MPGLPFAKPTFPCIEALQWHTVILKSADGTEQRISSRRVPRQSFTYRYPLSSDADVAKMDALIHNWGKGQWYVPVWPEQTIHTADLAAGVTSITMDTSDADYRGSTSGGNRVIIWQSTTKYEIVTVTTVNANSLVVSALTNSYTGSKIVAPCRIGYLSGLTSKQRWQTGSAYLEMTFEITDNLPLSDYTSLTSCDNIEVLTTPSYMPQGVYNQEIDVDVVEIDSVTGRRVPIPLGEYNIASQMHQWVSWSKADAWDHRIWLQSVFGRQKAFLVPTFRDDITLTEQCDPTDTTIKVSNRGFTDYMGFNRMRTYLAFRPASGNCVVRRVTSMTELSATEESIGLSTAPGATYTAGSHLSWADICRFASDRLELEWHRPGCNIHTAQLIRVHNPAAVFGIGAFGMGIMP